jgi:hypothetical protein
MRSTISSYVMDTRPGFPPLEEACFSRPQACAILGLADGKLKGILDRKLVEVQVHNPGRGGSRKFSTSDLIKLAVAVELARIGVPMRVLAECSEMVLSRAHEVGRVFGDLRNQGKKLEEISETLSLGLHMVIFPEREREGKWRACRLFPGEEQQLEWPNVHATINVDGVLYETMTRAAKMLPLCRKKGSPR